MRSLLEKLTAHWAARSLGVGVASTALDVATLLLLARGLGLPTPLATALATGLGCAASFLLNKFLAFRDSRTPIWPQAARYAVTTLLSIAAQAALVWVLADRCGLALLVAKLAADLLVFGCAGTLAMRFVVFREAFGRTPRPAVALPGHHAPAAGAPGCVGTARQRDRRTAGPPSSPRDRRTAPVRRRLRRARTARSPPAGRPRLARRRAVPSRAPRAVTGPPQTGGGAAATQRLGGCVGGCRGSELKSPSFRGDGASGSGFRVGLRAIPPFAGLGEGRKYCISEHTVFGAAVRPPCTRWGAVVAKMRGIGALLVSSRPGGALEELAGYLERRTGLPVATVADGREALSLAVELRPALVVTELMVAGLDGLSLCRALRREPALRGCRALVTSTLCAGRRALEAGADAFLQMPCDHGELAAAALQLLGRTEGRAEASLQA